MNPDFVVYTIEKRFSDVEGPVEIPTLKGKTFTAEIVQNGIYVSNLGSSPFLPWEIFKVAFQVMQSLGGRAEKGNAMDCKLGDHGLDYNTIEGRIAFEVYGFIT